MLRFRSIVCFVGLAAGAASSLGVVDNTWDWKNCCRDLYFDFGAGQYDPANKIVGMNPLGGNITLKDSFLQAVNIWNAAQANNVNKWNLHIGAAMNNCPQITVMLGANANGQQPVDQNNVPRFTPPPSIESNFEDPTWMPGGGNGPGPMGGLGFFRRFMTGNIATKGEIIFNPNADFALFGGLTYDPVIASLHEIGHAMKLDHGVGAIMGTPYFGSIMLPKLKTGVHDANSNGIDLYNPSAADIADADTACATCIPAPGFLVPSVAGFSLLAARRRRAA